MGDGKGRPDEKPSGVQQRTVRIETLKAGKLQIFLEYQKIRSKCPYCGYVNKAVVTPVGVTLAVDMCQHHDTVTADHIFFTGPAGMDRHCRKPENGFTTILHDVVPVSMLKW